MADAQVQITRNCNGCSGEILNYDHYVCRNCHTELCDRSDCLDSHRKQKHDVFHVTNSGEYRVDERVSTFCDRHPEKPTDVFCQTCREAICVRCSAINHNSHDVLDTTDVLADKKRIIERDTSKLTRGPLQAIDTAICSFNDDIDSTTGNYEEIEKAIDQINNVWMAEVNSVTQALKASLLEMKDGHIGGLRSQKKSLEMQKNTISKTIGNNHNLLKGCNSEMLKYESDIDEMFSFPSLTEISSPSFRRGNIESAHYRMSILGNLKYTPNLTLSREEISRKSCLCFAELLSPERREIPSHYIKPNAHILPTLRLTTKNEFKNVKDMSCAKSSAVWIYDTKEESIALYRENESKITMFTNIKTEFIAGISETEVLYSDNTDNAIKSLSVNGNNTLFSTGEWNPFGMAIAKDGMIYVCQQKEGVGKVSKYLRNGEMLRDFKEAKDKILYQKPYRIAENINGDVCTIDRGSPNAVVIVSRLGKFKNRYEGGSWNSLKLIFSPPQPSSISTDSDGNILVCDGNKIHLLDIAGEFMQYLDVLVSSPILISVDKQDFLWVIEKQSIKMIEYLKRVMN